MVRETKCGEKSAQTHIIDTTEELTKTLQLASLLIAQQRHFV